LTCIDISQITILHIFRSIGRSFSELEENKSCARKILQEAEDMCKAAIGKRQVCVSSLSGNPVSSSVVPFSGLGDGGAA
jgi:hypothetical protein